MELENLKNLIMDYVYICDNTAQDWAVFLIENFDLQRLTVSEIQELIFDEFLMEGIEYALHQE